jgi:PAS domain S-box-containing protein
MNLAKFAELTAELDLMAQNSEQAVALLESFASALIPAEARDLAHLTWGESRDNGGTAPKDGGPAADAEAKLKSAQLRFRTLVEQIPAVTFMAVLGEGQNEVYVSPHIEAMLGFRQDEWLADPFLWYWQLHPDDRQLWNDEFARGCQTGGPFRAECRFLARDGRVVWVHGEARVAKDERGRPLFLQGVAFDITESKRAQEVLLNEAIRTAKVEEEFAIARRVQTSILPRSLDVAGLDIAAIMIPASEVGGDYYDVIPFEGGAWLAIGDVAGHGLNAGLIMLMLQSAAMGIIRAQPKASPRELLIMLNDVLYGNIRTRLIRDEHVTLTLMRYTRDGRVVFAGAHEDIILFRASTGTIECIRPPGIWIGAKRDISRVTVDALLELHDGDVMVLYSDGITEATDAARKQFDIDRLMALVEKHHAECPAKIRDHVIAAVQGWMAAQDDDISLVVMRYRAPGAALRTDPVQHLAELTHE